ncbi:hypothetical protein TG4357_02654 [Thalassovita gelatinovora]|uniref:Uncharacterized protein n=1 Tax=Thalassovita gelatinovora TaxID=53501 RepID=A0A0P1FFI1_THAGE|nr:hypothetical protein [Thalassovita gelatinovora]QIZ79779.1 hypothetical protein HFZ77_04435 [Thalassovita gelatinovora]CUH66812.1 hypothetical protein TG4357_02654 [Thalassovita gelatinovora]SEQ43215.1 hypothetical protein SAMN04488043_105191 [Thalassovita gelatinovora]
MSGGNLKGEVRIPDGDMTWTVVMNFNTLCDFEEVSGEESALDFVERLEQGETISATRMRQLFYCGLKQSHPEVDLADAGRLLSDHPDAVLQAMMAASPTASDLGEDEGGSGN